MLRFPKHTSFPPSTFNERPILFGTELRFLVLGILNRALGGVPVQVKEGNYMYFVLFLIETGCYIVLYIYPLNKIHATVVDFGTRRQKF